MTEPRLLYVAGSEAITMLGRAEPACRMYFARSKRLEEPSGTWSCNIAVAQVSAWLQPLLELQARTPYPIPVPTERLLHVVQIQTTPNHQFTIDTTRLSDSAGWLAQLKTYRVSSGRECKT